jgi:hypothetical protein
MLSDKSHIAATTKPSQIASSGLGKRCWTTAWITSKCRPIWTGRGGVARARNVKPGLFKNEILGVADPLYTLLFEGLWLLADRDGKLEDRPVRIKGEVFAYRDGLDMEAMLDWLQTEGFIRRYVVAGKRYILVLEFKKHQNPHKNEVASEIPDPCSDEIGTTSEEIGSARADSLSSDSLIPEKAQAPARKRATSFDPREIEIPDWLPRELWVLWCNDRQDRKKPISKEGAKQQLAKLDGYRAAGHSPRSVIEHSIAGGYQGLFAPALQKGQSAPEPREWFESKSGLEQKARELGLDPHRIDEQWPEFRKRVMTAVKDLSGPPLTLDQLSAMAERRAA